MTERVFQAKPFVRMAAPTVRSICGGFLKAMDSFAADRLRKAVPVQTRRTALGRARRGQLQRTRAAAGQMPTAPGTAPRTPPSQAA
jgi:hypothetical protein